MKICALISFIFEIRAKKVRLIIEETQKAENEETENPEDELNFDVEGAVKCQIGTVMNTLDPDFLKEIEESLDKTEDTALD